MKRLILFMLGVLLFAYEPVIAETPIKDTMTTDYYFLMRKSAANYRVTPWAVRENINHCKSMLFRIAGADSASVTMTKVFSDILPDTVTYTLAKSLSTGIWTLTTPYNTPFTASKTRVTFSPGQATGKFYFSYTNTSTSVITIYCYLQTTDALTNTAFTTNGTFMQVDVY